MILGAYPAKEREERGTGEEQYSWGFVIYNLGRYNIYMKTERENLEGLLTERTVEQLCGLTREFRLKGFSRLDKGGLVALLLDQVDPG